LTVLKFFFISDNPRVIQVPRSLRYPDRRITDASGFVPILLLESDVVPTTEEQRQVSG